MFEQALRKIRGISPEESAIFGYLEGLPSNSDRGNVAYFMKFVEKTLEPQLKPFQVGVIAIGSTTRPPQQRHHVPRDIDIRILNSAATNSSNRIAMVYRTRTLLRDQLTANGINFKEADNTDLERMVPGVSTRYEKNPTTGHYDTIETRELVPFLDYRNNDPSFVITFQKGLPLHISISGIDHYDLSTHLAQEKQQHEQRHTVLPVVLF